MASTTDIVSDITAYESGQLPYEDVVRLFQSLLDSGMIFALQGHYQRVAQQMIEAGEIVFSG